MRAVLFDLDGTLMLTGGAGVRGMNRAGQSLFGERFSLEGVSTAGGLDPLIYRDAAVRCGIDDHDRHHDAFRERYLRTLAEELALTPHHTVCLPGVLALLSQLRERSDALIGMVTGNYRGAAPLKLRAGGIDPEQFKLVAYGDEAPTRPDMVALALRRHHELTGRESTPQDFLVVGDTPKDIDCAHAHGIPCLAVATGLFTLEQLRAAGADQVVANLSDPSPILSFLAA